VKGADVPQKAWSKKRERQYEQASRTSTDDISSGRRCGLRSQHKGAGWLEKAVGW
jgi:hypothetical protein